MASRGVLDAIASTEMRRSRGLGSTQSPSNACAQRRTVDRVSEIGRSRLNRAFGDHGVTSGHIETLRSRLGGQRIKRSWDRGAS